MMRFAKQIAAILVIALVVTSTVSLLSGRAAAASYDNSQSLSRPAATGAQATTQIIVKYKNNDKAKQDSLKANVKSSLKLSKLQTLRHIAKYNLDVLDLAKGTDINQVVSQLMRDPNVEYAQPNFAMKLFEEPLPQNIDELLAVYDIGQIIAGQECNLGTAINALPAWDISTGSPAVIVAVLDTGIDISHPELAGATLAGWDFVNDDSSVYDSPAEKHGTHIAGIIAAKRDGEGISGIAPNITLLPLKVAEDGTVFTDSVLAAIEYAENMGASIVNASWGGSEYNPALEQAIAMSGMLFVCAAGNSGNTSPVYPAAFDLPNVLSVGAVDPDGHRAVFSNYGEWVDVAAPGVTIISTIPESSYGYASGTSMAAGYVSGAAVLLASHDGTLTAAAMAARIKRNVSANEHVDVSTSSGGIVDAYRTLIDETPFSVDDGVSSEERQALQGEVYHIISTLTSLNGATAEQKEKILGFFGLAESAVLEAEQLGNSLIDSIEIARQAAEYGFTISQVSALLAHFSSVTELEKELGSFARFIERYLVPQSAEPELKDMLVQGYGENEIRSAYVASQVLPLPITNLLAVESADPLEQILASLHMQLTAEELAALSEFFAKYIVNQSTLLTYVSQQSISITQLMQTFDQFEQDRFGDYEETYGERIDLYEDGEDGSITVEKYFDAPFSYRVSDTENVNLNTGALEYSSVDLSIPGINGLDLNVVSRYDSGSAKLFGEDYAINHDSEYKVLERELEVLVYPNGNSSVQNTGAWKSCGYYSSYSSANAKKGEIEASEPEHLWDIYNSRTVNEYLSDYTFDKADTYWYYTNPYEPGSQIYHPPTRYHINKGGLSGDLNYSGGQYLYETGWRQVSSPYYWRQKFQNDRWYRYHYSGWIYGTQVTYIGSVYRYHQAIIEDHSTTSYDNITTPTTYDELRHNLGSGWSLGFSSIEMSAGQKYLHLGNGNAYRIDLTSTQGDSNLHGYVLNDLRLETDNGSYSNGAKTSAYLLIHKDGKKEYFADDGRLLGIQDRFGNTIKFEHTTVNGTAVISKITDTANRVTTLTYSTTPTGRKAVITAPDNSTVQYFLEPIPGYSGEYQLAKKIDQAGRETTFSYEFSTGLFSFFSKSYRDKGNIFANLKGIYYPTGACSQYTYEKTQGNFGNQGSNEYFRVKTRQDMDNGMSYDRQTYQYLRDYTGYGQCSDPANLPSSFTYETEITAVDNTKTNFTFDHKHLKSKGEVKENGTILTHRTEYEYDANKLPVKVVDRIYNKGTGQYLQSVNNYAYDSGKFGDLVAIWDSQAERNSSNQPLNDEHKTSLSYDASYHYLIEKTYKRDANHTIREEYQPSADHKTIAWAKVYENNQLRSQTAYAYDSRGNLTEAKRYLDNWTDYVSTKYSYLDNIPARNGQLDGVYLTRQWTENVSDIDGNPVEARPGNPAGTVDEVLQYDLLGRLLEKQDGLGSSTSLQYDSLGRVTKQINPDSSFRLFSYDDLENSITFTDENGNSFKYDYDGFGHIVREQDLASGAVLKQYQYDQQLRLIKESNYNDERVTEYWYTNDDRLQLKRTKDSQGRLLSSESYEYSEAFDGGNYNRVIKFIEGDETSPSIITSTYTDKHGRVVKQGRFNQGVELLDSFQYDYLGNRVQERSARAYAEQWPESFTKQYEYNHAGQVVKVTDVDGTYAGTAYDALGRTVSVTDKQGNLTLYSYDSLGRLLSEQLPFAEINGILHHSSRQYRYDRNGHVTLEQQGNHLPGAEASCRQTEYAYDSRNRLVAVVTYDDGVAENYTQYYYDHLGNKLRMYTGLSSPLTITSLDNVTVSGDADYSVTQYAYDRFNHLVTMIDPLGQSESYSYDLNGNQTQKVDRNGSVIIMTYDGLGRLLQSSVANSANPALSASYSYSYALSGAKAGMTGGGTATTYGYDDLGRLIKETSSDGSEKQYSYDAADNRTSLLIKVNGAPYLNTTYSYDRLNRLATVQENGTPVAGYTYYDNGNRASLSYANGNLTDYEYNLANRLTRLTNKQGTDVLSEYVYTYYLDGNQSSKTDQTGQVTEFTYDDLGRLTGEARSGEPAVTYAYDDSNNRASLTVANGPVTSYAYDRNNRLLTETKVIGDVTETTRYSYDRNGNEICRTSEVIEPQAGLAEELSLLVSGVDEESSAVTFHYYDGFNQLIKTTVGNQSITYGYNGNGLRTSKQVNDVTTIHVWDDNQIALELNDAGQVTDKYVRGINLLYAEDVLGQSFYLFNGHGDVVQLTGSDGSVIRSYDYDAFGNEVDSDPADSNVFRYCGEYFDRETGTYYLRARYYDPVIGRFITEDTYRGSLNDPLSLHLYTYAYNNPLRYVDPSGHMPDLLLNLAAQLMISGLLNRDNLFPTVLAANISSTAATLDLSHLYKSFHNTAQVAAAQVASEAGYADPSLEVPVPYTDPDTGKKSVKKADLVAGGFVWEVKPEIAGKMGKATESPEEQLKIYTDWGGWQRGDRLDRVDNIMITPAYGLFGKTLLNGVSMHVSSPQRGYLIYGFDLRDHRGNIVKENIGTNVAALYCAGYYGALAAASAASGALAGSVGWPGVVGGLVAAY